MGTSIVIPGADFSQSGLLTKNYVDMQVTQSGYVYYGGDAEVYSGKWAVKNWSSKLLVEEGTVRIPLCDLNGKNFQGFAFKYEKQGDTFIEVSNYPKLTYIKMSGELPQENYTQIYLSFDTDLGIEEADFSSLTREGGLKIIFINLLPKQKSLSVFKQPNQDYNVSTSAFADSICTSLNLSNATELTAINNVFTGCSHLEFIDFSNLQTAPIVQNRNGFERCTALTSIKVTNASSTAKANLITKLADVGFTFVEQNGYLIKQ